MDKLLRLFCFTLFFTFGCNLGYAQIVRPVNDTTICAGESVILEAKPGSYMYNWSTGDLSKTITVSPLVTTSYNLRVFIPDTGTEMITNGDFDLGNMGFYSEYVYCPDAGVSSSNHSHYASLWQEGRYAVDDNPNEYHANFSACGGHTGNNPDNYLIVNGAPDENVVVWSQTINVNPNQYYAFSTWACNVHPTNPARLEFMIDGVLMGDYIEPSSGSTCAWEEFYSLWHSGTKTSIVISIVNKNLIRSGNDYALDGISFNPLVEVPDTRTVTVVDPAIVNAGPDQTICGNETAILSASASNHTGFLWSTLGDGTFSDASNFNSNYTPGANDRLNGSVILLATADSNNPCGQVVDDLLLTLNPVPFIDFGGNQASCGGGDYTLDAGNPGSTYLWSTGETSQTIDVSTAGNYTVEITNSFGCVESESVYVGFYPELTIDLGADRTVCTGNPVVLNAGISGGTYLWSTGETTQEIIVYTQGNYSVTVTDSNGCTATDDINVNLVPPPTVDLGPDQVLNDGDVITLDAGSQFMYVWDDGSRGRYLNVDKPGLYSVRVYDMNGCSAMDMVNITSASGNVPDVTLNDTIICRGESVELYAGNDFLFNWDVDGLSSRVVVAPDSTATYNLRLFYIDNTLELVNNGHFTLGNIGFQSDYYYCSNPWARSCRNRSSKYGVDDYTRIFGNDKSNCSGVTGNSNDNMLIVEGDQVNSTVWEQDISVDPDSYYVFSLNITNLKGSSSDDFDLVIDGKVVLSFSTASPCDWNEYKTLLYSDSSNQLNIQINNTNTTGVDNAFALDAISMFKLSEIPLDVTVEVVQHVTADAGNDLVICESGTAGLNGVVTNASSYIWKSLGDGTFDNSGLLTATYTPGVTDIANGFVDLELSAQPIAPCLVPDADTMRIDISSNLAIDIGPDKEICDGNSVVLNANYSGGSYLWSTGETTQSITVAVSGIYNVIVTDIYGCSGSDEMNLIVYSNPVFDLGADQETCEGVDVMLDAGLPGSTYLWSTGETLQAILVNTTGNYSVTLTDINGCSANDDVNVTVHPNPTVDLGSDQETCNGNTITLDAGNAGSSYLWSTGETTQTITVSTTGNYSVVVTDANGCSANDDVNVTVHPNPTVDLGSDQETCAGNTITLDAGIAGSTYLWNTGETTQKIIVSTSGNYSVVVTDGNGCSATDDVNVTVHPNPTIDLGSDQETCDGNIITLDAGNAGSTYLWSTGEITRTITVNASGNYSVVVTNGNGCSNIDTTRFTKLPNFDFELMYSTNLVCHGDSTYIEGPNQADYIYQWKKDGININGATNSSITTGESGRYILEIINSDGCHASDSVDVEIINLPNNPLPSIVDMCYGESVKLDIGDGERFLWSDGVTTQSREVSSGGMYHVEVHDINGCIGYDSVEVIVHDLPIVDLGPDLYICEGEELILEAPEGYYTEWNPGGATRSIYVYEEGSFELFATDEFGCTGKDDINIFVHENPEVYLGRDTVIGEGSTIILDAGSGYVEYEWSNQEDSQYLKVQKDGEYAVTVVDVNGCRGNGKVKVAVNPVPTIDLGDNAGICEGTALMLDAGNWEKYLWSTGEETRTIIVNKSGQYTVQVWDVYGIMGVDTINVEVYPSPEVEIYSDTLSMYKGQTITLDAGSGYVSYYWNTGSDWRSIEVDDEGEYTVEVTNDYGCVAQAAIAVKLLQPKMVVPNVFTPNGKGPNEIFYPVFKGVVTDFEMYIYTRWGEQVFELKKDMVSNNELKYEGWNGTYKGTESPIGVYVWIIFYGGKERDHGTVTLFR